MTCKHFCEDFEHAPTQRDIRVYLFGFKRCDNCEVVYRTANITCSCCGRHLSDQPASHRARLQYREVKENLPQKARRKIKEGLALKPEDLKEVWAEIQQTRINRERIAMAKQAVALTLGL
jgi:hypothetical protein